MAAVTTIRQAIIEDAAGLGNCMTSAYSTYQERMGGLRLPPQDVDYASEISNYPCWVVESDSKIVGGLIMELDSDRALIANIAVAPDAQGRGIGGKLMQFAESEATARGFSALHLTTQVLLVENLALYRHLGWQETGRDASKVYMRKQL